MGVQLVFGESSSTLPLNNLRVYVGASFFLENLFAITVGLIRKGNQRENHPFWGWAILPMCVRVYGEWGAPNRCASGHRALSIYHSPISQTKHRQSDQTLGEAGMASSWDWAHGMLRTCSWCFTRHLSYPHSQQVKWPTLSPPPRHGW